MALMDDILLMQELGRQIEALQTQESELRREYDRLRLHAIPNAMAEQDTTSIKGDWGRCTLQSDLHVKVNDKVGLHDWLNSNGHGSLIVPTVNAQTLKAFCKEQIVNGAELPEIVEISPFSRAVIYKN